MRKESQSIRPCEHNRTIPCEQNVPQEKSARNLFPAAANEPDIFIEGPKEDSVEGEELTAAAEARVLKTLVSPEKLTEKEVQEHDLTHCSYRSWCPVCVEAAGREDQHRRRKEKADEGEVPTVGMDYNFLSDGVAAASTAGRAMKGDEVKAMIANDFKTSMLWAHAVDRKGPQDKWITNRIVADIKYLGRSEVKLKTDGEPAIKAVQSVVM